MLNILLSDVDDLIFQDEEMTCSERWEITGRTTPEAWIFFTQNRKTIPQKTWNGNGRTAYYRKIFSFKNGKQARGKNNKMINKDFAAEAIRFG